MQIGDTIIGLNTYGNVIIARIVALEPDLFLMPTANLCILYCDGMDFVKGEFRYFSLTKEYMVHYFIKLDEFYDLQY